MCKISETVKQIWWEIRGASHITCFWEIEKDVDINEHSLTINVKGSKKVKIEGQNTIDYTVTLMRTDNSVVATKENVCCDNLVQTIDTMLNTLRVGDTIKVERWSGNVITAKIERIERCTKGHEKCGVGVNEVPSSDIELCSLDLEGGYWCYGDQILEIL